jgi:prophage regulatory protein
MLTDDPLPPEFQRSSRPAGRPRRRGTGEARALEAVVAAGGDLLLRGPEVCAIIGVSIATLYRMLEAGEFPRPISPSRGTRAWPMSVVQTWIKQRATAAHK